MMFPNSNFFPISAGWVTPFSYLGEVSKTAEGLQVLLQRLAGNTSVENLVEVDNEGVAVLELLQVGVD